MPSIIARYETTPNYTFGFEAEFATEASPLVTELHRMGFTGSGTMHNYTCDCDVCAIRFDDYDGDPDYFHEDIYRLRAKYDSSCGGEIISKVFDNVEQAIQSFDAIQQAALITDTEPGLQAGFHVHVGRRHLTKEQRGRLVMAMTLWENVLFDIAAGRWPHNRGWNVSLLTLMHHQFRSEALTHGLPISTIDHGLLEQLLEKITGTMHERTFYRSIADEHQEVDRHSTMAFSPRWPTMEFRLWNSTRAAWRMELWCRLSRLLANPDFVNTMLTDWHYQVSMDDFLSMSSTSNDTVLVELLERQIGYVQRIRSENVTAHSMPFSLT
jgi:hypothetical protein